MNLGLIIGCARSGTSILGELVAAHPDVRYLHEAHEIWRKAGLGENDSHRLTAEHATPQVVRRIRKRFERERDDARLLVEKCPRSALRVPFIRAVLPEAKIIHIVRDGRDVSCSLMPGIGGDQWRHLKPPNWRELMARDPGVVRCARAWRTVVEIAIEDLADVPHLCVRYEDMVADPRDVACRVVGFLGLDEHPAVLEFCDKIQNTTRGSYQAQRQEKWSRDDHTFRIGRWRENLSDEQAATIEEILRPVLVRLGYVNQPTLAGCTT
jgi:hypothetical protein